MTVERPVRNATIPAYAIAFGLAVMLSTPASAECTCQCVGEVAQPYCTNALDVPPVCPATLCTLNTPPVAPPSLTPLQSNQCGQSRVCDAFGNCTWREICQ